MRRVTTTITYTCDYCDRPCNQPKKYLEALMGTYGVESRFMVFGVHSNEHPDQRDQAWCDDCLCHALTTLANDLRGQILNPSKGDKAP